MLQQSGKKYSFNLCVFRGLLLFLFFVCYGISIAQNQNELGDLLIKLNQTKDKSQRATILSQIGSAYQIARAHKKALEYLTEANQMYSELNASVEFDRTLDKMAYSYEQIGNYAQAISLREKILEMSQNAPVQEKIDMFEKISLLSKLSGDHQKVLSCSFQLLNLYESQKNKSGMASAYNNAGVGYKKMGIQKKSIEAFRKALEMYKQSALQAKNASEKAVIHQNMGVIYTTLGEYRNAKTQYLQALSINQSNNKALEQAKTYNFLALNDFLGRNYDYALTNVQSAIGIAEKYKADEILEVSYKILADIYQEQGDNKSAQNYYQKYNEVKNNLIAKAQKEQQALLENQINIEKKETDFKLQVAEKEKQELELNQMKMERERQEKDLVLKANELALLKKNQELKDAELKNQLLERGRVEQLLQLTRQRAEADKQKQAITLLEKNKELQGLALKQQEAEKKQRLREIESLEKDKKSREKALKDAETMRKYTNLIIALGGLILTLVITGLLLSMRTSRKLKAQNREIEQQRQEILTQNEELHQNQEEILTQRDYIEKKNAEMETANAKLKANEQVLIKTIEKVKETEKTIKEQNEVLKHRNNQINSSINSAMTIQQAILPYQQKMEELLGEYFVIYFPKDVVSGDFFWLNEVDNKIILAAVDCTGHGVPGAFMSLIGNTVLDKIVRVWKILEPAQILSRLHDDIQVMLRQKETNNNSGMDAVVLAIEKNGEQTHITFSGAKRPMYYIHHQHQELQELTGDRKSIGGIQNESIQFTNQKISLEKGSLVYIGSDGYFDQNNVLRKRLGEKRFKEMVENLALSPLEKQKTVLEQELQNFMQGTTQRDDILLIGFKV